MHRTLNDEAVPIAGGGWGIGRTNAERFIVPCTGYETLVRVPAAAGAGA
ncbi:hypothetical protein [Streptomyces hygroscopicus]|nr:hypothetical protein [Streptomyces hygroscopicus]